MADPLFTKAVGLSEREEDRRSIAVMPFVDMSPGQDQGHFCDGIAEEVINALTQVNDLRVAARTSSFAFKGAVGDIRSIGQQLGVEAVLEGSLRKADTRVRVTVQLVSVADGYHIWSRQYDRELDDILAIQTDIARDIADAMELEVEDSEKQALEVPRSSNAKAYDFYLRGREYFYKSKRQGIKFAIGMFERAIDEDPSYGLAYAGLADCHSYLYMYFGHAAENLDGAEAASRRAVDLNPALAEAHAARGLALNLRSRWAEAESEFERAIELNSNLFEAYYFYGRTCFAQGKLEEARDMYRAACRVSPHDYQAPNLLAFTYNSLKEFDKVTAAYRIGLVNIERRLETHPDDARAVNLGALALAALGERDLAIEWGRHSADLAPDDPYILYGVACIYGRLGMRLDDGLDYFGKAIEAGFAHKEWIEQDDDLNPFREHPLFQAIVERLK
jgi:TolB-like protein/Flp pilus assembly protein TadD